MSSPNFGMTLIEEGQNGAETTTNDALLLVEALAPLVIEGALATPPGSPGNGKIWIVIATATGDWTGQEGNLAIYNDGWQFRAPHAGWKAWRGDLQEHTTFIGGTWQASCATVTPLAGGATLANVITTVNDLISKMQAGGIMHP